MLTGGGPQPEPLSVISNRVIELIGEDNCILGGIPEADDLDSSR